MSTVIPRLAGAALLALIAAGPAWARLPVPTPQAAPAAGAPAAPPIPAARGVTPRDLVALEAFGRATLSPDGRWAVWEKRGPWTAIPRFDYGQRAPWTLMDLWVSDLTRPDAPPERLLPGEGPGLLRVAWSPSGAHLLIYRMRDDRFEIGVVRMADRSVRWTGLTPEIPVAGASAQWLDDATAIVMTRPDGSLPAVMRSHGELQARMRAAWARTSEGREPSRTVLDTDGGVARPDQPEPERALVRLRVSGGPDTVLIRGALVDVQAAPDGRRLAVVMGAEPVPMAPGPLLQADPARRQRLGLIDPGTGETIWPLPGRDVGPQLLRWSADSARLLVWVRSDGAAWSDGDLVAVSGSGAVVLRRDGVSPGADADLLRGVRAEWLGDRPVLWARDAAGRFDWRLMSAEAGPTALTGGLRAPPPAFSAVDGTGALLVADQALWRVTAAGAARLTDPDAGLREARIGDPEAVVRLQMEAPRRDWAPLLGPEGESLIGSAAGVRRLGPGAAEALRTLAASPDAALVLERVGLVETLRLRTADGDRRLDGVNAAFADVALPAPRPIDHRDAEGRPTRSWLHLPPDRAPGAVRGLVVAVYPGGAESGYWAGPYTLTTGLRAEVLAGAGFAVLSPALPPDGEPASRGEGYVRAVDLVVDAALDAVPGLPGDRIAVLGHSFGGYAALEIATRSARYRSYVVSSGMSDLFGHWGEFIPATRVLPEDGLALRNQQGWVEAGQGALGASPWEDPAAYVAASPWLRADRITAPVLLLTADRDYVPVSQSERVFSALHRLGGRARLVTYWGEHHNAWSPANIQDRYGQIFRWLDETVSGPSGPEPDPGR